MRATKPLSKLVKRNRLLLTESLELRYVLNASGSYMPLPISSPGNSELEIRTDASLVSESLRGTSYQPLNLTLAIEAISKVTTTNSQVPTTLYEDGFVADKSSDGGFSLNLVNSTEGILLNQFRADPRFAGIDGTGFSTVIIDTGIDLNHPHFGPDADGNGIADRIVYQQSFINAATADDLNGHGTHVAATVASSDSVHKGMTPGAGIIALQTNNAAGRGPFSAVEQALQWTILNATTYNIASVNMSLGDSGNYTEAVMFYGLGDELAALAALDVIVVSASGNDFATFNSPGVGYPSADPNSLSIGSRRTNTLQASGFSQRHPE